MQSPAWPRAWSRSPASLPALWRLRRQPHPRLAHATATHILLCKATMQNDRVHQAMGVRGAEGSAGIRPSCRLLSHAGYVRSETLHAPSHCMLISAFLLYSVQQ